MTRPTRGQWESFLWKRWEAPEGVKKGVIVGFALCMSNFQPSPTPQNPDPSMYPSDKMLGRNFGCTERQAGRHKLKLEELGLIERVGEMPARNGGKPVPKFKWRFPDGQGDINVGLRGDASKGTSSSDCSPVEQGDINVGLDDPSQPPEDAHKGSSMSPCKGTSMSDDTREVILENTREEEQGDIDDPLPTEEEPAGNETSPWELDGAPAEEELPQWPEPAVDEADPWDSHEFETPVDEPSLPTETSAPPAPENETPQEKYRRLRPILKQLLEQGKPVNDILRRVDLPREQVETLARNHSASAGLGYRC